MVSSSTKLTNTSSPFFIDPIIFSETDTFASLTL
ncbi:uncharacterized protein METZ01_LOCUS22680 [marine metagenome]|uniref:Uncharacterized protein n=1 Tax=marine metagenome TaxID=408172 RepID=A0A381PS08_9ZZZZ